jgi:ubiquinone/menaquinone biosynthesis C-methylase UbiE
MLAHLRRRLSGFSNVRTVALDGFSLDPIPSASVDLVYCTVVFMHLDEWERYGYIREGLRVLKPGGRMFVDNINLLSDEGWAVFLRHKEQFHPRARPPSISKTSTPQELDTYFRRAGFANVRQKEAGVWIITYGIKPAN